MKNCFVYFHLDYSITEGTEGGMQEFRNSSVLQNETVMLSRFLNE